MPFPDDLRGKYQDFTEADLSQLRAAGYDRNFMTLEDSLRCYWKSLEENAGMLPKAQAAATKDESLEVPPPDVTRQ